MERANVIEPGRGNRILLHASFRGTLNALRSTKIKLPTNPVPSDMDFGWVSSKPTSDLVTNLEPIKPHMLDARNGQKIAFEKNTVVASYDESINKFSALEGTAYFTSHSMVFALDRYVPINLLTMYFYTRSEQLHKRAPEIKLSTNPSIDSQKDYLEDKVSFILSEVPKDSILFIDGPIIAGDVYTTFMSSSHRFRENGILPVFFVKNSNSNMVIDNMKNLGNDYNSDLHWSNESLKPGQRSCFFKYTDRNNPRNTKVFCYFKAFQTSPLRVEFFTGTYEEKYSSVLAVMDLIYYLALVHGDIHNPQIRPIAIAEKYARETLKLVNFQRMMLETGLQPTVNQDRFAW